MTPISLTLNATTEQHAIADFVNKILAQFKKTPNVMLQVHINDEPWVARDFILFARRKPRHSCRG